MALAKAGDFKAAAEKYEAAVAAAPAAYGADSVSEASVWSMLGTARVKLAQHALAAEAFRQALRIRELRKEPPAKLAVMQHNLACELRDLGQLDEAAPLFEAGVAFGRTAGNPPGLMATRLQELAFLYLDAGRLDDARPLLAEVRDLQRTAVGEKHADYAQALLNLAVAELAAGRPAEAGPHLRAAAAIWEAADLPAHDRAYKLALCRVRLGVVAEAAGKWADALAAYREAAKGFEESGRDGDTEGSVAARVHVADALAATGDWAAALAQHDAARRKAHAYCRSSLQGLSEGQQRLFLQRGEVEGLRKAAGFAARFRDEAGVAAAAAEWLVNGKGATFEALAARARSARDAAAAGPKAVAALGRLRVAREGLAKLTVRGPAGEADYAAQVKKLAAEVETASRDAGLAAAGGLPPWVKLADIRKALPAGAVFVDVAKAPVEGRLHYAAWVVTAGDVAVVDFGPADDIDDAVRAWRWAVGCGGTFAAWWPRSGRPDSWPGRRRRWRGRGRAGGPSARTTRSRPAAPAAELARRLLAPLAGPLKGATRLVVSPEGELWQLAVGGAADGRR